MQSVELVLDPVTEAQLVREWRALADAGLPSQSRHTGASNRPHVTLAVSSALAAEAEERIAAAVTGLPLPIVVGGLSVFGSSPYILVRSVTANAALLELQARVHAAVEPTAGVFRNLQPGRWNPHITLGRRMSAPDIAAALVALDGLEPLDAVAVGARRWDSDQRRTWDVRPTNLVEVDDDHRLPG